MVNRGRSKACQTCKDRRVKCDEAKPECRTCKRLSLQCGGYKPKPTRLKFKDETHKFSLAASTSPPSGDTTSQSDPQSPATADMAVSFYLQHYASAGRNFSTGRGFFETLVPIYHSQPTDSSLAHAISAVALSVLHVWRDDAEIFKMSQQSYANAVSHLRVDLNDDQERHKTATVLAILALQLYENVSAVYGLRPATPIHHLGALSLLSLANLHHLDEPVALFVRKFIVHVEVSSALRQQRRLQEHVQAFLGDGSLAAKLENPSMALDMIGAAVADLQARWIEMIRRVHPGELSFEQSSALVDESKRIDEQLCRWAQDMPDHLQPRRVSKQHVISSPIPTYQDTCDVYPSCQIANLWSLWRSQRLLLVKIALISLQAVLPIAQLRLDVNQLEVWMKTLYERKAVLRFLVDSACHSIPFHMGNRSAALSLSDFTDPSIVFLPNYDELPSKSEFSSAAKSHSPPAGNASKDHIIARAPWHLMSPLSHLLTLLSEDHGELVVGFLKDGQHNWLREQFLRLTAVGRIHCEKSASPNRSPRNGRQSEESDHELADRLAKHVRESSSFLSGM